jgi:hypothetical protein
MKGLHSAINHLRYIDANKKTPASSTALSASVLPAFQTLLSQEICIKIVQGLLKQAMEKINKVRETACVILESLLHSSNISHATFGEGELPLPHIEILRECFPVGKSNLEIDGARLPELNENVDVDESAADMNEHESGSKLDANAIAKNKISTLNTSSFLAEKAMSTTSDSLFHNCMPLLHLSLYRKFILSGLVISIGGLTESTVRNSADAIVAYITEHAEERIGAVASSLSPESKDASSASNSAASIEISANKLSLSEAIAQDLLWILNVYKGDPRVIIPVFKSLDILLSQMCFSNLTADISDFGQLLYLRIRGEIAKSTNVNKIMAAVNVLLGLLQLGEPLNKQSLSVLVMLLAHPFPKVRRVTAENLYTRLQAEEESLGIQDTFEQVMNVIMDTPWDGPIDLAKGKLSLLFTLLHLPKPTNSEMMHFECKKKVVIKTGSSQMTGTYADLVAEMH